MYYTRAAAAAAAAAYYPYNTRARGTMVGSPPTTTVPREHYRPSRRQKKTKQTQPPPPNLEKRIVIPPSKKVIVKPEEEDRPPHRQKTQPTSPSPSPPHQDLEKRIVTPQSKKVIVKPEEENRPSPQQKTQQTSPPPSPHQDLEKGKVTPPSKKVIAKPTDEEDRPPPQQKTQPTLPLPSPHQDLEKGIVTPPSKKAIVTAEDEDRAPPQQILQPTSSPPPPAPHSDVGQRIVTPPSNIVIVKPPEEEQDNKRNTDRVLLTYQIKSSSRQSPQQVIRISDGDKSCQIFHLKRGGCLKIYPNLVDIDQCNRVKAELLISQCFRVYKIQGTEEPRAHFLLHEDATDNFEGAWQPGYRYNGCSTTLKSRPLSKLKEIQKLSEQMKEHCKVDKWTIGINPVLYRGNGDKMGDHADDDQGEEIILAVVIDSPESPIRRINIKPKGKVGLQKDGDEAIELFLRPGDAYEMDGEMQKWYSHAIPRIATDKKKEEIVEKEEDQDAVTNDSDANTQRIVIVFRTGQCKYFPRDSGKECLNLSPPVKQSYAFGSLGWLQEGELYSRAQLFAKGGHLALQRGLSGNQKIGCDAIIVSGLRDDGLGIDWLINIMYAVERCKGAESVVTSMKNAKPIRIFRSTRYKHYCGAKEPGHRQQPINSMQQLYRYDGLYFVYDYREPRYAKGPYQFFLKRYDGSPNRLPNAFLRTYCEKSGTMLGYDYLKCKGADTAKRRCDDSYIAILLLQERAKRPRLLPTGKDSECGTCPQVAMSSASEMDAARELLRLINTRTRHDVKMSPPKTVDDLAVDLPSRILHSGCGTCQTTISSVEAHAAQELLSLINDCAFWYT